MTDYDVDTGSEKARAFFQRAEEVAATDNFDYAIDMYIEGLRLSPENVEDGHIALRRLALIRQGKGGKKPSIKEKLNRRTAKKPLTEMLNAEYLLAKDPDNLSYAENLLKAAMQGTYYRTAHWIANLLFEANKASEKPSVSTYMLLIDAYEKMELYSEAVEACRRCVQLKPDDSPLLERLKNLSAKMTMQKGKYGLQPDYKQSIKDIETQRQLHSQQSKVKTLEYRTQHLQKAKEIYENDPSIENILQYADAMADIGTVEQFDSAVELLQKHYQQLNSFPLKKLEGEIKIKKLKKQVRDIREQMAKPPENKDLKQEHDRLVNEFAQTELRHFQNCAKQYPTDLRIKFELGLRYVITHQYDKAIPLLQEAQKDPRQKLSAMDKTGLCFFLKGWYADAIDIFREALRLCEVKDSPIGKELRYNLARSLENQGQKPEALELHRKLMQLDYGYKDVSERVKTLRDELEKPTSQQ